MSGSKSRNKGRGYEYEIANELFQQLGINFVRELDQTREKHLGDLRTEDCNFPFVIECKRYKSGVSGDWWDQVCTAAAIADKMPMLCYRLDRQKTRVRMPVQALTLLAEYVPAGDIAEQHDWRMACEMDIDTACYVIREILSNGA
jgi:hypothetical protein